MVTLYYMRRYVRFLQQLLANETDTFALSAEVSEWFADTAVALSDVRPLLGLGPISEEQRYNSLTELGQRFVTLFGRNLAQAQQRTNVAECDGRVREPFADFFG